MTEKRPLRNHAVLVRRGTCVALLALVGAMAGCPIPELEDGPTVQFSATPRIGDAGEMVQFEDLSGLPGETPIAWAWDLGDGATSAEQNPMHTYAAPGAYDVSLSVTTQQGVHSWREPNFVIVRRPEATVPQPGDEMVQRLIPFVWIPAGSFVMGSESAQWGENSERPAREVTITHGFWMSRYEITQAQWATVMGTTNPSYFPDPDGRSPVESVSWYDVQAFVSKLNRLALGTFRLPTEAEWEYACRAGSTTEWSFGNDGTDMAGHGWCYENEGFRPRPTGSLAANAWGLYDMHGNVMEWCQDPYDAGAYAWSDATDPMVFLRSPFRVARGGSWYHMRHQARSAYRYYGLPDYRAKMIGFRICRN